MLIPQVFLVNKEWKMMLQVSNLSGQSNSPMAGRLDYAESEAMAIREAAYFIR